LFLIVTVNSAPTDANTIQYKAYRDTSSSTKRIVEDCPAFPSACEVRISGAMFAKGFCPEDTSGKRAKRVEFQ